jgi:hypothetical protein
MKPKEALVKDGFLPPGSENVRGRLSGAAIDRCKELAANGWTIEGYQSKSGNTGVAVVEKVKVVTGAKEIADIGDPIHDENEWEAYITVDDKRETVDMRKCCNQCQASLTYCPHPYPTIFLDYNAEAVVSFKQRTSPLVRRWW